MGRALLLDSMLFMLICITFVGIPFTGQIASVEYNIKIGLRIVCSAYFISKYIFGIFMYLRFLRNAMLFLFLYIFLAAISFTYSINPLISSIRTIEIFACFCAVNILVANIRTGNDLNKVTEILYVALITLMVIVGLSWWLMPDKAIAYLNIRGDVPRLGGQFVNPNALGVYSGLVFLGAFHHILRKEKTSKMWLAVLLFSLAYLILSKSRTAVLGTFLSATISYIIVCYRTNKLVVLRLAIGVMFVVLFTAFFSERIAMYLVRGESEQLITRATGRLDLWAHLLDKQFFKNMAFGSGFQMISDTLHIYKGKHSLYMPSAHNGFLQALIGLGLIGFILLSISTIYGLFFYLRRAVMPNRPDFAHENNKLNLFPQLLALYLLILIHSMFEAGIGGPLSPVLMLFFLLLAISTSAECRRV
jgi:O-antigen ligase